MLPHPPPGPARRRLVALCVTAFAALVVGIVVGAGGGSSKPKPSVAAAKPPAQAVKKAKGLSLERQIGEILMIAFHGTTPPGYVQRALRQGRASGVILFRANAATPASTRALTRRLQRAGRHRVLIATDQEGGPIRILPWVPPTASQGATPTELAAKTQAHAAARGLTDAGVNVTLAPVADVGGQGSVMTGRAFPGGAADVSALTRAAVSGYRGTEVAPTLKHFPGLGEAGSNTDDKPVTISSPRAALATRDLPPFAAGIKAGAPLVMASHALFTGLDPKNIASQSKPILTTLLRGKLGFKGVVVTDSMEAAAVLARSSIELAALRSVAAGADLLLLTGPGSFPVVYKQLLTGAKQSKRFRARVAEAAARVIALKRSLGLKAP
ncbi:MAG TPA: glycoside hydrolase family 3 N-terminal domain-containing protein [Thermoleophilaceae bacterium]|nr:glycoside hydrolase family 3 N-terminal domain-containing protein [Thermoleophilaceae bacterium]